MTQRTIRGDAPAVAKVIQIPRPDGYSAGAINIDINNKTISWPEWSVDDLVDEWNNSQYPETRVATASRLDPEEATGEYGTAESSLILTANNPGEDFFVSVRIGESTETNEIQTLSFPVAPSGGTFTLEFDGQTTGAITYVNGDPSSTAANILAALLALSNIDPGDVSVTAVSQTEYRVTFEGNYEDINVPLMTVDYTNLLGGDNFITVTKLQDGVLPTDEVQTLSLPSGPTGGTFTLTYAGQTTGNIAFDANAATVQAALVALSNIEPGDVVCAGGDLPGTPVTITFEGNLAGQDVSLITGDGSLLTGGTANVDNITTTNEGGTGTNKKAQFFRSVTGTNLTVPSSAQWFTVDKDGTQNLSTAFNPTTATAAEMKALLVGMTVGYNIGATYENYVITTDDVDVTLSGGRPIVEFKGVFATRNIGTVDSATPGFIGIDGTSAYVTQAAVQDVEQQQFEVLDDSQSGGFTITFDDDAGDPHTTTTIPYGPEGTDIAAAITQAMNDELGDSYIYCSYIGAGVYRIFYQNYGYQVVNFDELTINEGPVQITETTQGDPGVSELQSIAASGSAIRAGTYTITYDGQTTSAIAYNASAATIQAALEALSNIAPGDVTVSGGPLYQATVFLAWDSDLGNINTVTATSSLVSSTAEVIESITGGVEIFAIELTRNAGPECFDDPLNYSPEGLPSDGDAIVFEHGISAVRWGIKQRDTFEVADLTTNVLQLTSKRWLFQDGQQLRVRSSGTAPAGLTSGNAYYVINSDGIGKFQLSTTLGGSAIDITDVGSGTHTIGLQLASITKPARFGEDIGLPRNNQAGFDEYRPKYLEVWVSTSVTLGERQGTDSSLQRYDFGTVQITSGILVYGTGTSSEPEIPTLAILIEQASTNLKSYGGSIGFAPHLDEDATLQDIECYDTQLSSVGLTTCRNITLDKDSNIQGNFDPSGNLVLGV